MSLFGPFCFHAGGKGKEYVGKGDNDSSGKKGWGPAGKKGNSCKGSKGAGNEVLEDVESVDEDTDELDSGSTDGSEAPDTTAQRGNPASKAQATLFLTELQAGPLHQWRRARLPRGLQARLPNQLTMRQHGLPR